MENQFSDLPTIPMTSIKPPQNKRRPRWLVILLIGGILLVIGLGISILSQTPGSAHLQTRRATPITSIATATPASQPSASTPLATPTTGTPTQIPATPTPVQKPTPTPTPPLSNVTHGRPHLGGLFSDFVGAYGTPIAQGDSNSQNFLTGPNQTIDLNAIRNEQGIVTQLTILGPNSWDTQQTQSECMQFLPDNAVQFNTTTTTLAYHSSIGDVLLQLQSASACLLSFSRS